MLHNFGSNHLRLDNLYTIRVGRGNGPAHKLHGYAGSVIPWWTNDQPNVIEQQAADNTLAPLHWQSLFPDCWRQTRWMQCARVADEIHVATASQRPMIQDSSLPPSVAEESNHDGRLSTIPEEDSLDIQSDDTYLSGEESAFEVKLTQALSYANLWCNASSLEPDENHVLHSCLDATSRKDVHPCLDAPSRIDVHPCLDAISRKDHGWEDKLLADGFPNVPYLPPLEIHASARDMTADGLTKGSVDRIAVHLLMSGEIKIVHEPKLWKSLC